MPGSPLDVARHMTDEQWVSLIDEVSDEERNWQIWYPGEPGASLRGIDPEGNPFVIRSDGSVLR